MDALGKRRPDEARRHNGVKQRRLERAEQRGRYPIYRLSSLGTTRVANEQGKTPQNMKSNNNALSAHFAADPHFNRDSKDRTRDTVSHLSAVVLATREAGPATLLNDPFPAKH
ncbi:hypothetical protein JANAI62_10080 [Jannaschia pagri]|uniref:Uncharacterized protein n=1 Tax=Jannaschia pagri TaxID=2829797 RepID=A0ABQ4NIZ1_9RHOB|nr:hypothetical protein JANAI62_10080 [Jannaschia sp. AI_62]